MGKKWEQINYEEIQIGDTIRHTVEYSDKGYTINIGKVEKNDPADKTYSLSNGQWIYPDDVYFDCEDNAEGVITERKRVKQPKFAYPEGIGSVVKGISSSGMKRSGWFIKVGVDKYYNSKSGAFYNEHEIDLFYTNLEVVYESNVKEEMNEKGS